MQTDKSIIIAKNTLLLYFRMFFTMAISLYTSRVILNTLGIRDFGIYNIIGGVVLLFSFLNNAMLSGTQRFLNYELGKNDHVQVNKIFNISILVHASIAFIALLGMETLGLWFIYTKLNLPLERIDVVGWVYQFTIITFLVSILRVPFNATIIAHEQMSFYAYISVIEVSLKLLIVFILQHFGSDKLKLYAILDSLVSIIVLIIYIIYCKKKFSYVHYHFILDKKLYHSLLSFSGWNLLGSIANVAKIQVTNIILNIFGGVVVNAAMAIANQVSITINNFVSNFQIAFNPQIVKSFASGKNSYLFQLICKTSKLSYFLLLVISLPFLINSRSILFLWLSSVPEHTVIFCELSMISLLLESLQSPLWMAIHATGIIKRYQIIISGIILLGVPLSYFLLEAGYPYFSIMIVNIGTGVLTLILRMVFLRNLIGFPIIKFIKVVLLRIILVSLLILPIGFIFKNYSSSLSSIIVVSFIYIIAGVSVVYFVGFEKEEKTDSIKLISYLTKYISTGVSITSKI